MMKKLAILIALASIPLAAHGQLVTSNGLAAYGTLDPPLYGNGSYVGYNAASASEFDFFNVGSGPFYWYELNSGSTLPGSPVMMLNGTTLTVANIVGNISTATALAATPTQCASGQYATGIAANGNANCTTNTLASGTNGYYTTRQVTLSGSPVTLYDEDLNTGALNNNTTTTVTLPFALPTAVLSCVCSDNSSRVQSGNDQPVGCNVSGQSAPFASVQINTPATGVSAYCRVRGY